MAFRTNKMPVLQEKSASGAVASFNTALAMPLASCNIAVNAWQEGSGDASPDNERPIHGFSEVNATVNNVVHTIQLGQDVYGAEVDVVNGVVTVNSYYFKADNNLNIRLFDHGATNSIFRINFSANNMPEPVVNSSISSHFTNNITGSGRLFNDATTLQCIIANNLISPENAVGFKAWLIDNDVEFKYELAEPFDIQLTPTQIETLIGNNTIFADTGDIDLTYKDLDIAKRGNFREVFKLPS